MLFSRGNTAFDRFIILFRISMDVKIENIVCSGSFNQELNLLDLARAGLIDYDPEMYHGGYIKTNGHSVTIYRTGKYIMPGMKTLDDIRTTFESMKEILSDSLDISKFDEPSIRNLVCSSYAGYALDLSQIFVELLNHDYDVSYEPELFPGLILKTEECTYNVFSSGKFLILGCKDIAVAEECEKRFLSLLNSKM